MNKGKDPLKEIFWGTKNADGTKGFVRNPFAPGAEYGYDFSTYEKWQQKAFRKQMLILIGIEKLDCAEHGIEIKDERLKPEKFSGIVLQDN